MNYKVNFIDVTNEKPDNMVFKIRGNEKEYETLQDLQENLTGKISKHSEKEIIIDWQWAYESGNNQESIIDNDKIDTNNSINLSNYKFKINVLGEEVV